MSRLTRSPNVVTRRVAGEAILVSLAKSAGSGAPRTAELFVLNDSAELLWQFLEQPRSVEDLARKLTDTFGIVQEQAQADAHAFASAMLEMDALRPVED